MTALILTFFGWLVIVFFIIGFFRVGARDERRLEEIEAERASDLAGMPCPWPQNFEPSYHEQGDAP